MMKVINTAIYLIIGFSTVIFVVSATNCNPIYKVHEFEIFWIVDIANCHMYTVCEPIGKTGNHQAFHKSCGQLFWDQDFKTCVKVIPKFSVCDKSATAPTTTTTTPYPLICDFEVDITDKRKFKPKNVTDHTYTVYQSCDENFFFSLEVCTCLRDQDAKINCNHVDFLRFHFDGNFDDSSCTRADARVTEGHVGFARSPRGMAADFTGLGYLDVPVMRNIFAGGHSIRMSVSLFFKTDNEKEPELIFDNGKLDRDVSILLGYLGGQRKLVAQCFLNEEASNFRYTRRLLEVTLELTTPDEWHHVAYVYDNGTLTLTVDGKFSNTVSVKRRKVGVNYTIRNIDQDLSLGGRPYSHFNLNGMIDEFRLFKRALSMSEVKTLSNESF